MLSLPLGWLKNTKRDQWMSQVLCWSDWSGELTDWKETREKTWENVTSGRGFPQHTANTTTRQASAQLGLYTRDYFGRFATINLKPTTTQEFKKKNMKKHPRRCTYGIHVKIPGDFLLELSLSQDFQKGWPSTPNLRSGHWNSTLPRLVDAPTVSILKSHMALLSSYRIHKLLPSVFYSWDKKLKTGKCSDFTRFYLSANTNQVVCANECGEKTFIAACKQH